LAKLGGVRRNGHPSRRLPNTLNVSFPGLSGEDLLIGLDLAGLAVSSGSACLVGSIQPSHVLAAMGLAPESAGATVRFSIDARMADEDLDEILARTTRVVNHQRSLRGLRSDRPPSQAHQHGVPA
jgi:cysteine desulfurase